MKKNILGALIALSFLVNLCVAAPLFSAQTGLIPGHYAEKLSPLKIHQKADREILKYIQYTHYLKPSVDDRLSSRVLDTYLSDLDSQRSFFLASDVKEFDFYRYLLDDVLKTGDLKPPFRIYNRYQERMAERLAYMIKAVENGIGNIKLDQNVNLEIDRKKAPWPKNRIELEGLWQKALINDILNLLMDDKSPAEVKQTLSKRYRSQLNRVSQTNSEDVFQIFMNSFAHTFDPHTEYFSPRSSENFSINMSLSLEGIGAMLGVEDEYVKVVRLIPAGPADKSGQLKPDDRITGVGQGSDGEFVDVVGWRLDDVVDLIRGPKETVVRLRIIPANALDNHKTKSVSIVRNTVKLEEQAAHKEIIEIKDKDRPYKLGVIIIPTFYLDFNALSSGSKDYKSTTRDVMKLLAELREAKVDGIVVDLRDNGGGSLQEAEMLTGLFIDQGPVVQIRDANNKVEKLYDDDPQMYWDGPLAVVVNRLSASASEIFAGAIQDYARGIIIGEDTFGKGTVQSLVNLDYGQLKLTSAKFYRISGASTQHRGIVPDIAYPSLYDKTKIGESSLDAALPWDTIGGVSHRFYIDMRPLVSKLKELHQRRMASDPDYLYVYQMTDYLAKLRSRTDISLNRNVRKLEEQQIRKKRLDMENVRRNAKGLQPLKTIEALSDDLENKEKDSKIKAQDDPVLVESCRVLMDFVSLQTPARPAKVFTLMR